MNWWRLKNTLFRIFHPSFWFQNEPTDWEWDAELQCELFLYGVEPVDKFSTKVGEYEVWTVNYPYSFGYDYSFVGRRKDRVLPAPLTRVRLRKMLRSYHEQRP